jgi:hypothetical protein
VLILRCGAGFFAFSSLLDELLRERIVMQSLETVPTVRFPGCSIRQGTLERTARATALFVLGAGISAWGQTAKEVQPACPSRYPAFPQMTYDEAYRYFNNPDCRTEFWDALKFLPLRDGHEGYFLSFGAAVRERGEYYSNPNWASHPPGGTYSLANLEAASRQVGTAALVQGSTRTSWTFTRHSSTSAFGDPARIS